MRNRHLDNAYGEPAGREGEAMLVLPKAELLTGDRLTCLVSNKATQRATNLGQQNLLAEIIVTVQSKFIQMTSALLNQNVNWGVSPRN